MCDLETHMEALKDQKKKIFGTAAPVFDPLIQQEKAYIH
jgi:hypothetical protein